MYYRSNRLSLIPSGGIRITTAATGPVWDRLQPIKIGQSWEPNLVPVDQKAVDWINVSWLNDIKKGSPTSVIWENAPGGAARAFAMARGRWLQANAPSQGVSQPAITGLVWDRLQPIKIGQSWEPNLVPVDQKAVDWINVSWLNDIKNGTPNSVIWENAPGGVARAFAMARGRWLQANAPSQGVYQPTVEEAAANVVIPTPTILPVVSGGDSNGAYAELIEEPPLFTDVAQADVGSWLKYAVLGVGAYILLKSFSDTKPARRRR